MWPTDEQFVDLTEDLMMDLELTHIHFNEGTYVESLTFQVNNDTISIMQHPPGNNYSKKHPKEIAGNQIRRIEATVNKKKSMITSISFLGEAGEKLCDIQGKLPDKGEKCSIELGPTEVIVGCR